MKIYILLIPYLLSLILSSCNFLTNTTEIKILNRSNFTIYVYCSYSDSITQANPLALFNIEKPEDKGDPLVIYGRKKDSLIMLPEYRMNPYLDAVIRTPNNKKFFDQSPDKQVRFFYISEKIMRTKTWDEIVKDQLYIKKDIYKAEDIEPYFWTIEYYDDNTPQQLRPYYSVEL